MRRCRCSHAAPPLLSLRTPAGTRLLGRLPTLWHMLCSCSGCVGGCCLQAADWRELVQLSRSLPQCTPVSPRTRRSTTSRSTTSLPPYSHCTTHARSIHCSCISSSLGGGSTLAHPRWYLLPSSSQPILPILLGNPSPPPFYFLTPLRVPVRLLPPHQVISLFMCSLSVAARTRATAPLSTRGLHM